MVRRSDLGDGVTGEPLGIFPSAGGKETILADYGSPSFGDLRL